MAQTQAVLAAGQAAALPDAIRRSSTPFQIHDGAAFDEAGTAGLATATPGRRLRWSDLPAWRRSQLEKGSKEDEEAEPDDDDDSRGYGDDKDDGVGSEPEVVCDSAVQAAVDAACCDPPFTAVVDCPGTSAIQSASCPDLQADIVCCAA